MREGTPSTPPEAAAALQRAARQVLRKLYDASEADGNVAPEQHLIQDVESVRSALERILEGSDPSELVEELPSTAVPLVSFIRSELLQDRESAPRAVLEAVRAVEGLDRAWRFGAVDDTEADLRAWLARPDALELVVALAHDLRSPLTSIIFLSETIQKTAGDAFDEVQRRQLSLIYIAALGLSGVVADVVELAASERDLVDEREVVDFWVVDVFEEVARLVMPISEEKGIELRLEVGSDERFRGHPSALSRVLLNLATNALKFTEEGHVEIGVRRVSPSKAEFWVQDTGRGIPAEQVEELFLPYRRRSRDRSHYFSVSGLGLSICQRYLRAMGSELQLETTVGEGTRFHFELDVPGRR